MTTQQHNYNNRRLKQFEKAQSDKQKKAMAGLFDRMSAAEEAEKPPASDPPAQQ
jgi:hypothetical protein